MVASFCAINSTQIVYAQNSRPYAFCLFLSCLSILWFLRWVGRPAFHRNEVEYVASTVLLFYSHYIFFPLILIQGLGLLWCIRTQSFFWARKPTNDLRWFVGYSFKRRSWFAAPAPCPPAVEDRPCPLFVELVQRDPFHQRPSHLL